MKTILIASLLGLSGAALWGSRVAYADNCGVLEDAMSKMATATTHMHIERAGAQGAAAKGMSDVIMSGDKMYVQIGGGWHSMPRTDFSQMKAKLEQARANKQVSCDKVGEESLGGRAASIYHVTDASDAKTTDAKIWLAKNNGLPLRVDSANQMSVTYDYDNVQIPANAQPMGAARPHVGG